MLFDIDEFLENAKEVVGTRDNGWRVGARWVGEPFAPNVERVKTL